MIAAGSPSRRSRRGFALLAVMWVVIVAGLILLGVRRNSWANSASAYNDLGAVQARWLARAGAEQAMAVLSEDPSDADGADELWYDSLEDFQDFALEGGTFTVCAPSYGDEFLAVRFGLVDHAGLLNIATADANQLAALGILDESQIDSILDWVDGDDEIRTGGAEAGYYNRLTFPYEIRNGRPRTVEELRLIRGIDDETFYGEDADLDGVLDRNEDDGDASPPHDDADGVLRPGLAGLCTVWSYDRNTDSQGQARLNMNQVGRSTMVQQLNFTDALADAVVQQRRPRFRSLMDLVGIQGQAQTSEQQSQGTQGQSQTSGGQSQTSGGQSGGSSSGSSATTQDTSGRVNEITLRWIADHTDQITVTNRRTIRGLINVNTASKDVLLTLPSLSA
ncbi:MAG: general secretion pathway protein GspK, partial [Phycisphaerae bacterium]|nr:general secretion pathway protein GspK [Phycisphaerae bacterium]